LGARRRARVAIVGSEQDVHARYVADAVARAGGRPILVDTDRVPDHLPVSWRDGSTRWGDDVLDDVRCFYLKSIHLSIPASDPEQLQRRNFPRWLDRYRAERERHSFLTSILRALDDGERRFVNAPSSIDLHFLKVHQLEALRRLRVPVPATLATNDADAVRAFAAEHHEVVYKPLSGGAAAQLLTARDLTDARLALLRNCPALFQERIVGDELRVYLLDGEPLRAFRVPTDGPADARANLERARPARVPDDVARICRRAARGLGLAFTAADVRVDRDGRVVVLELNPTPAIAFYEDPVRGKVMRALAAYLVRHA
jgi:glutathione synthase/RimK-type ligase-like ATP-grasp enzyme